VITMPSQLICGHPSIVQRLDVGEKKFTFLPPLTRGAFSL
jgi:hypothetical protein